MTDWEGYEHVERRDSKERRAPEGLDRGQAWRARIRRTVLHYMYPRSSVDKYWFEQEATYIPSYVAGRLHLEVPDVRRAMTELVEEGFLSGPLSLQKTNSDGSSIHYDLEAGKSLYQSALSVEWDGSRWVEAVHQWGSWRKFHKPDGRLWRKPPQKIVERALKKAMAARRPVEWDGRGFETRCARNPFRSYGYDNGFFKDVPAERGKKDPEPDMCRRCGTEVKWKSRSGKRRRDHGVNKCNLAMVRKIMED